MPPRNSIIEEMMAERAYGPITSANFADATAAARANEAAHKLGMPADVIDHALPDVLNAERLRKRQAEAANNATYAKIMSNKRLAMSAMDDDHLPKVAEQIGNHIDKSAPVAGIGMAGGLRAATMGRLMSGVSSLGQGLVGAFTGMADQIQGPFSSGLATPFTAPITIAKQLGGPLYQALGRGAAATRVETGDRNINDILSGVESAPTSLAALGATLFGGPLAGAAVIGGVTGGHSYMEGREAGLTARESAVYGLTDSAIELATEWGPEALLKRFVTEGGFKAGAKALGVEVGGEVAATALQGLNKWWWIDRDKGMSFKDFLATLPDAERSTVVATLSTMGLTMGAGYAARDFVKQRTDQDAAVRVDQIMEAAAQSPTRTANPTDFGFALSQALEDTAAENIYVPAEEVTKLFDPEKGEVSEQMAADPFWSKHAHQLTEATALGGDMVLPLADAATHLAGTPQWEALRDHARVSASGASISEAKTKKTPEQLQELATQASGMLGQVLNNAQSMKARQIVGNWAQQINASGEQANVVNRMLASSLAANYGRDVQRKIEAGEQPVSMEEFAATYLPQAKRMAQSSYEAGPGATMEQGQASEQATQAPAGDQAAAGTVSGPGQLRGGLGLLDVTPGSVLGTDEQIEGAPTSITVPGRGQVTVRPHVPARQAAIRHMINKGLSYLPTRKYAKVDEGRATRIAAAFETMPHAPSDPLVKAAYDAMIKETLEQFQQIKETGLEIEFITGEDPYAASPRLAILDVQENNHLWVFPTEGGFGQGEITDSPLLEPVDEFIGGRQLLANDVFRIVHDYFGHIKDGHGFRAEGEENAWQSHAAMYTPLARRAMTTETRGQNSWLNFGPHAAHNRKASGSETIYAPQKIGLLPEWASEEGMLADPTSGTRRVRGFHGTPMGFDKFAPGKAVWFAEDESLAERYANPRRFKMLGEGRVIAADLDIRNPLDLDPALAGLPAHTVVEKPAEWVKNIFGFDIEAYGWDRIGQDYAHMIFRSQAFADAARDAGYDALKITESGSPTWGMLNPGTAFSPEGRTLNQAVVPGEEGRISTRMPTTNKATENGLTEDLSIGLEAMKAKPEAFKFNMGLVKKYIGFITGKRSADGIAEDFIQHATDNLLWLHDQMPEATRQRAKLWYDGARNILENWVSQYGASQESIAGVIASLSPQKDWYQNVSLAERVLDVWHHRQGFVMSPEMEATAARIFAKPQFAADLAEMKGKSLGQLENDVQRAMFVRIYDQAHNPPGYRIITPEGQFVGEPQGNVAWGSLVEIGKAVSSLRDPSQDNVSLTMGAKHKVRNFFNNIISPQAKSGDVTIDTHAVAAALLRPLSGSDREVHHNFGSSPMKDKQPPNWQAAKNVAESGAQGLYGLYAEAYRRAAAERGILPREMQSITWEAVRGMYSARFKANKKNVANVNELWDTYRDGKATLEDTRNAAVALAGGIERPSWERLPAGASEEARPSSYEGELSGVRVSGRGSDTVDSGTGSRASSEPFSLNQTVTASEEVFYSAAQKVVSEAKQEKATAQQWKALLTPGKTPGIKTDEIEWTGVHDWLDMQEGQIQKGALLQFLRDRGVQVEEVLAGEPKKTSFNLASGEFTDEGDPYTPTQFGSWSSNPGDPSYRELLITLPIGQGGNPSRSPSTHWNTEGVVAHTRFMDKTDAEGKRVMFIEEVQSDWHQKGRDQGYEVQLSATEKAEREADYQAAVAKAKEADDAVIALAKELGYEGNGLAMAERFLDVQMHQALHTDEFDILTGTPKTTPEEDAKAAQINDVMQAAKEAHRGVREADQARGPDAQYERAREAHASTTRELEEAQTKQRELEIELNKLAGPFIIEAYEANIKLMSERAQQNNLDFDEPMMREIMGRTTGVNFFNPEVDEGQRGYVGWSDINGWLQMARSIDNEMPEELAAKWKETKEAVDRVAELRREENLYAAEMNSARSGKKGIPNAPFKSSWPALVMKRIIRYAAENGYDKVAWTTGKEQASRYNLSQATGPLMVKKVTEDSYSVQMTHQARDQLIQNDLAEPDPSRDSRHALMTSAQLKEAFGNDVAKLIGERTAEVETEEFKAVFHDAETARLKAEEDVNVALEEAGRTGTPANTPEFDALRLKLDAANKTMVELRKRANVIIEGEDLTVGGEGMKAFYDRNLVNITNDIIKKYGAKVGKIDIVGSDSDRAQADLLRERLQHITDPVQLARAEATLRHDEGDPHPGFEITDKMRDAALGGFPLFQQKRGNISIMPGPDGLMQSALIRAFEASNFSTAVHELGHFFLEDLRRRALSSGASDQERADWAAFKNWSASLGQPVEDDSPIPVDGHEFFARGFERFTWEGQAPSRALKSVFFKMREFMLDLYKRATQFNAPISAEIREVMGRMIASDEEVVEQRKAMALASGKLDELMTEEERAAYQALGEESRQDARDALFARVLSTLRREKQGVLKEGKQAIQNEVEGEVDNQPVFRALKLLTVGTPIGDGQFARIKLSRQQLLEVYGEDAESKMPRMVPHIVSDNNTLDVDQIAALAGFDSGDQMVKALMLHAETTAQLKESGDKRSLKKKMVDEAVQDRVRDELGDPFENLEEEAMAAIANDRQADQMSMELRAISRKAGRKPTPWRLAKEWAEKRVRMQSSQEATTGRSIQMYARNASKAGQAAEEALIAGKFDEAFDAKQRQMLNLALMSEAKKAKDEVDTAVRRMGRLAGRQTIPSVDQDYLDQAHQLLEDVDLKQSSQAGVDKRMAFEDWFLERVAEGIEPIVPAKYRSMLGKMHWSRLTIDELLELDKATGQIIELGRLKKRLRDGQEQRDFDEGVMMMVGQTETTRERNKSKTTDPERTFGGRVKSRLRGIDAAMVKVEQMVEWLDGGEANGPWRRILFNVLADAQTRQQDLLQRYTGRLNELIQAMPKEQARSMDRAVDTPELMIRNTGHSQAGEPFRGTKDQVVMMAMNWGNEGNRQRLLDGFGWEEADMLKVFDRLMTAEDWQFVQNVWDLVNELWPEIEALERRVNGVAPEQVEATEVQTRHGTFRGGYFPVVFDPNESTRAELDEASKLSPNGAWHQVSTRSGATRARVDRVMGRPLMLNMGVITRHLGEIIHDVSHREAVVQARKILSDNRVRSVVNKHLGPEYYKRMGSWLENIATPSVSNSKSDPAMVSVARHLNKGVSLVGLGFRFTTVAAQLIGLSNIKSEVRRSLLLEGLRIVMSNPRTAYNEITSRSGEMRSRFMTMDASIDDMMNEAAKGKLRTIGPKGLVKYAFHGILYMDMVVTMTGWSAAYNQALKEGQSDDDAVVFADGVIRKTQGSGARKDRSAIMYENEFARSFWPFFSYLNALYNQQRDVFHRARRVQGGKDVYDVLRRGWWVMVVPTLVQALMFGEGPDDDDEEGWAAWLTKSVLLGNFASIPGVGAIASAAGSGFGYRSNAWQGVGEDILKVWKNADEFYDAEEDLKGSTIQKVLATVGIITAKPLGQIGATTRGIYDYATDEANPEDAGDWYQLLTKGRIPDQPTALEQAGEQILGNDSSQTP